ncbi:hypothetical protein [Mycolicibacterium alvei]|uniref:Secreted protein n=1 Tax=Mycolicibacterium alvei TaxID=67081 RepID=A0A6N4UNY3_9MYCO|nr:hypothetical protein [Mycolicibacterium alvei]MCV6999350.1 hypothetical protein [Mycolicibacterium alvei]BBX25251.1 hypothetical protein MALV_03760 [Mycolicibacterium alvei]
MARVNSVRKLAAGLGVVAVPMGIAFAGAGSASADPGLCVSGPYGFAHACVDTPGWYNGWYDGPRWRGGWDGNDQGEDD